VKLALQKHMAICNSVFGSKRKASVMHAKNVNYCYCRYDAHVLKCVNVATVTC
jgi:hypothetical protein